MASNDRYINIGMGLDIQDLRTGLSEAKREMALAESEFKAATAGLDKWDQSIDGVIAKLDQMAKEMQAKERIVQAYRAELQRVTDLYGENSKQAQEVQTKLNNAEASYTKAQKYTEELKKKLEDLRTAEANAGSAADSLKGSIAKAGDESKTASSKIKDHLTDALDKVKQSAEKAARDGFDSLKSKVEGFVTGALSKATNALKDFIKQTVQLGIDFSGTMSMVQANSRASAEDMARLEKAAREAGASTTFSAVEAAEALNQLALASWDADQSIDGLGGVLDLAAASGLGLAEASTIVTGNISAFGLEAKDASKVADLLSYAQSNANTTADQLGQAYKNSATLLHTQGQRIETVTALLMAMSNSNLQGSEAGTALAAVMRDISNKMKDGAIQIGKTSVKVKDQNGDFLSLTDILAGVSSAIDGLGSAEASEALSATFTANSLKGVSAVLADGTEKVKGYETALENSGGTAKETAAIMNDNLGGDLKTLNSTLDEIKLALFDIIKGPLRDIVQALTELLKKSGDVTDGVAKGFGNVTSKFEGASKGIDALANADWDGIAKGAEEAWNGMTESFSGVGQWAGGVWEKIKGAFSDPVGAFRSIAGNMLSGLKSGWDSVASFFGGIWDKVKGAFSGPAEAFKKIGGSVYSAFTSAWDTVTSWAGGLLDKVKSALSDPIGTIRAQGEKLYNAFKGAWNAASSWAGGVFETIKGAFSDPLGTMKTKGEGLWNGIKSGFSGVQSWFAANVVSPIQGAFGGLDAWATKTLGGVWSAIKGPFEGLYNWFKKNVADPIVGVFRPVLEFFGVKTDDGFDPLAGMREQVAASEAEVKRLKAVYDSAYATYQTNRSTYGYSSSITTEAQRASNSAYTAWNAARQELQKLQTALKTAEREQESGAGGIGGIKTSITNAFSGIENIITKPFTDAWNTITGVFSGIGDWFAKNVVKPIQDALKPVGEAVSGGVVGGMVDAKKGITTGTQTLGGWIVGGLCDVLGIHSPSKVMHDRVGLMIGAGVAEGIADSARSVRAASEALGASVALPGGRIGGQAARGPATVVYNQTINSPDPISVGQIYRDTRSLIGRREWA